MKRVLVLGVNPATTSPALRFRCVQFEQYLKQQGYSVSYSCIFDLWDDYHIYQPGRLLTKAFILCKATIRRLVTLLACLDKPVLIVQRESYIMGTTFFERCLKWLGCKMIYDIDDAVWLSNVSAANKNLSWLKKPTKTATLMQLADHVVAGNDFLAQYALQYNSQVSIIPTVVDTSKYKPLEAAKSDTDKIIIGWSGSRTTTVHFGIVTEALAIIQKKYGDRVELVMMGDANYSNPALKLRVVPWAPDVEISTIQTFDIGIMPLPDDDWSRGKCAFKAILYMSMGIPAVVSPIGANTQVVLDGINGVHASTTAQWVQALSRLIDDAALRKEMGKKARTHIVEHYSVQAVQEKVLRIIQNLN